MLAFAPCIFHEKPVRFDALVHSRIYLLSQDQLLER